ncbi:hypothetical protein ACLI1A_02730 [Flavobacterium sp. RHBU_3]|uniref:hypothetical protein n=1 Tax=Flavobacterium sp. RHBU_3 TaxID=3391184 RepID=UPI003984EF47
MKTFSDNPAVPETTYIYISKTRMYVKIVLGVVFLVSAVILFFSEQSGSALDARKQNVIMYAAPVFALLFFYQAYKGLNNKEPQLILNDEGLKLPDKPIMLWSDISDINLTWGGTETLRFQYKGKMTTIPTGKIGVKPTAFTNLLDTYRFRSMQKASN